MGSLGPVLPVLPGGQFAMELILHGVFGSSPASPAPVRQFAMELILLGVFGSSPASPAS